MRTFIDPRAFIFLLQKLEQDDDDVYLNSSWADSTALKKSFQGVADIKWKAQ